MSFGNSSNSSTPQSIEKDVTFSEWLLVFAFIVIMVTGVVGNLLVCYVFGVKKKLKSTTEWLILYLGVIDLLTSVFNPTLYIFWTLTHYSKWPFGYYGCKILPAIGPIMTAASGGVLLIFGIDRFLAIVTPFYGQLSFKMVTLANTINMLLSIASFVHYILVLKLSPDGNRCYVSGVQTLEYAVPNCSLILFRLVAFIVVFGGTNISIYLTLKRNQHTSTAIDLRLQRHAQSKRIMRVLVTMGIVFILLVFPRELFYLIYNLSWVNSSSGIGSSPTILQINSWLKVMHTANSCANVFIYAHMQTLYRKQILKFLQFMGCCKYGYELQSFSTTHPSPTTMLLPLGKGYYEWIVNTTQPKKRTFFQRAQNWKNNNNNNGMVVYM
ncbi:neuropeptides B/W receptor type 1-like [Hydractinia symbiolongicarpus]|uniref:neuropeptides B/W receptor type 1-like n=1 Tax=Hydractinia symbiolongicarpus TaxID=13093 RepID=UPI00254EF9D1|nr:neuropeptides B/W receptor type 1-like [Hydractinia symbiolongicarpus]